jgi:hypothetical protein
MLLFAGGLQQYHKDKNVLVAGVDFATRRAIRAL